MNHGTVLRVYPRTQDVGAKYTGCQVLFAPDAGGWQIASVVFIEKGEPVRVWSEDGQDEAIRRCRYKGGELVAGTSDECPMSSFLLLKSMAPGCAAIIRDAVAQQGLGARRPKQCEDR